MFHTIHDFLTCWEQETESTIKVFKQLTDQSLQQSVTGKGRSLGRLANHIIETLTEMPHKLGLFIEEENPAYTSVQKLVDAYTTASENLTNAIRNTWNDATLREQQNMYGQQWINGFSLWVLIMHQNHHRAQMTVLMRQAGLKVPGIYGPSMEEWSAFNMPAMN